MSNEVESMQIDQSADLPQYEKAEVKSLPAKKFVCVEYPGNVKNVDKAVDTLGSMSSIQRVAASNDKVDFLPLNFRPDDPYSHPIFGDKITSSNLLLKVTRDKETKQFDTEIVGLIPTTFRFRGMADFQYMVPRYVFTEEKIEPNKQSDELPAEDKNEPIHLPPPMFSRMDVPFNYNYAPNPLFKVEEVIEGNKVVRRLVPKRARGKRVGAFILDYESQEIPKESPMKTDQLTELELQCRSRLIEKFDERPIWTRQALEMNVPPQDVKRFKAVLPTVAYFFRNGPWRHTWVKYGYDPRKHPESKIYQVIDFRVKPEEMEGLTIYKRDPEVTKRPRRTKLPLNIDMQELATGEIVEKTEKEKDVTQVDAQHTFAAPPTQRQTLYQFVDIDDRDIQKLLVSDKKDCDKLNGWLSNTQLRTVRKTMKTKLKKMVEQAKEGPTRANETNADEDDEEDEFSAKEGNDKEDQHDSEDSDDELSDIEPLNDTAHTDMGHYGTGDNMGFLESLIQEMGNEGEAAGTTWEPYNIFGEDNDENSDEMHIMDEPANNTNNKRRGDELIEHSDPCLLFPVIKINAYGKRQRRTLAVSDSGISNLNGKNCQWFAKASDVYSIDKDPNEPHKFQLTFFHRYSFEADSEEQATKVVEAFRKFKVAQVVNRQRVMPEDFEPKENTTSTTPPIQKSFIDTDDEPDDVDDFFAPGSPERVERDRSPGPGSHNFSNTKITVEKPPLLSSGGHRLSMSVGSPTTNPIKIGVTGGSSNASSTSPSPANSPNGTTPISMSPEQPVPGLNGSGGYANPPTNNSNHTSPNANNNNLTSSAISIPNPNNTNAASPNYLRVPKIKPFSPNKRITLHDFQMLKVLGVGSFGKVILVRKLDNGKLYALKILKKEELYKKNQIDHTNTEREVLSQFKHPFMVRLYATFQTRSKLYLVIEFCRGGELFYHLRNAGRFPEDLCRFYISEVILALDFLHSHDIIYRDLKPENLLLDSEGHIKLTDFGLSKKGITSVGGKGEGQTTRTFCGTPEYLAPEIITGIGHGKAVDWWSVGILLYEMLTGRSPFVSANRNELYLNAIKGHVEFPSFVSKAAMDLIQKLLKRRPEERLGSGPDGVNELKQHAFFEGLDWVKLEKRLILPPYVPVIPDVEKIAQDTKDPLLAAEINDYKKATEEDLEGERRMTPTTEKLMESFKDFTMMEGPLTDRSDSTSQDTNPEERISINNAAETKA